MRRILQVATACWLAASLAGAAPLADAEQGWLRRAEGAQDEQPRPEPIQASIRGFEARVEREPDDWEARWKLLRSLHFAGEFLATTDAESRSYFERATRVSEDGLDRLARAVGSEQRLDALEPSEMGARIAAASLSREAVARLYFWSAIDWGAWSRTVGLLSAVREGVAGRLHDYTRVTLHLEPGYEDGGAYRLLGRLHAVLPKIPFLSGWVDRDQALPLIEEGFALAPEHPGNQYLLAVSLLDLAPSRRAEALELLRRVESLSPRPSMAVEDLALRRQAAERLAELRD